MSESLPAIAVLAGGLARRLGEHAASKPKALIDVAGAPFLDHQLQGLRQQGVVDVVLCLGRFGDLIQTHVGDGSRFGMRVKYSQDGDKLLGTGGAVLKALPSLTDPFFVTYGDTLLDMSYRNALQAFNAEPGALGLMTVLRNEDRWDTSNVQLANGTIARYEKASSDKSGLNYIDYGLSLFKREAFKGFAAGEVFDLSEVFQRLIATNQLVGFEVTNRFYEIGTPGSLKETAQFLAKGGKTCLNQ